MIKRRIMSSDNSPSPGSSPSPPAPQDSSSSKSSPSPKESPKSSPSSSPPPSSPPPSSPPPSSPPPSSPPPSSPPPSSSPPKESAPSPKEESSSSPPPPKESTPSSSPPPQRESTPSTPQAPKEPTPAKPTPSQPAAPAVDGSGENEQAPAVGAPPRARSRPSPAGALTPPSHGSSSSASDNSDEDNSSDRGKIAGVAIGVAFILIALLVVCIVCIRRKRRKRRDMQYYGDPAKGGGGYYNNTQQHNWHDMNKPQGDHVVRLNNQQQGGGGSWPSPPQMPMSSDEATTNYSAGPRGPPLPPPSPPAMSLGFNKSTFTYEELATATNGFSQANLLGQGGFGFVHKGVLPNGTVVAVKSLKSGSGQGEREFAAEVEIISRVHHRHLVSLVGYCIAGGQRMLVYEFVPNQTMEYHLHAKGLPPMDWPTRLRIATGSAKGLAYLHEDCHPKIIHRDIKSANILIDFNFEAMVADFGLAKLSSDNYTHVSTRVMGTFGYLAPEYASSGKLSEKSDVFSFGVMLLELITGKRPVDPSNAMEDSLVDWARPLLTRALEDGSYTELVDIGLDGNYNPQEMARMVACAAASIRHSARKRPKMSQIVRALEGDVSLDDLNEGTKPGKSSMFNVNTTLDYDTQAYNSDMKKFRKLALSSQDFGSSEFGTSSNDSREMSTTPKNPKQLQS